MSKVETLGGSSVPIGGCLTRKTAGKPEMLEMANSSCMTSGGSVSDGPEAGYCPGCMIHL